MNENDLPIENSSQEGREEYIEKNRMIVELVIEQALEDFSEDITSKAFGSQEKAVTKIIELFVSPLFSLEKVMYKNIKLFTQLNFWVKFKTAGNVATYSNAIKNEPGNHQDNIKDTDELCLDKVSKSLEIFNKRVAPDVIKYWLKANKKLLDELAFNEGSDFESGSSDIENNVSNTQETRYKVDAAFRYLFLYLGVAKQLETANKYVNKYLTKGENKPQYVSTGSETHQEKHHVRLSVIKIIDKFCEIHKETDSTDVLTHSLLKVIAKKAVLDVYEINSNKPDKKFIEEYSNKLKSFKQIPSFNKDLTYGVR